ncbi:MAG: hypothetical protein IIU15_06200 [Treponema sp.]|nr:hypothetical protein [Treponema sp.]
MDMDQNNRPRAREKNVTNNSTGVYKRGEGLGTGPVGSQNGYAGRTGGNQSNPRRQSFGPSSGNSSGSFNGSSGSSGGSRSGRTVTKAGGGGIIIAIIAGVLYLIFGRGGKNSNNTSNQTTTSESTYESNYESPSQTSYTSTDSSVASGSRAKRTQIVGNGQDTITLMVYMCGADLESKNGMASSDLGEMANANLSDKINLIVYTGGSKQWKTKGISNKVNQIYKVENGGIRQLVADDGQKAMTDPSTLSGFIKWAAKNYPANRYELIFWDHGGGSVSGYGYDENFSSKGSMNLANIDKALKNGGVKFDFIGFDTCLMATAENALMLDSHADYMIASEETEPGIGWYYTNWLTNLSKNTSMPTLEIGKTIVDDFTSQCNIKCSGQKTTLSVIDLAEFSNTVPNALSSFAKSISNMISANKYQTVSDARYNTREFSAKSKIDQIDLVDLCLKMNTSEGKKLANALQSAIKYNKTSRNMTNAYGVSIYFPYQRASYVDQACDTYEAIGMGDDYANAIRQFAKLEVSGQVASGGTSSPLGSLLEGLGGLGGIFGSSSSSSSSSGSSDIIGSLLGSFLGGGVGDGLISGLTGRNIDFMSDPDFTNEDAADYIAKNHFDPTALVWKESSNGKASLSLSDGQWKLVHALDKNMFYDDGEGYIDLGLDNTYSIDGKTMTADTDRTWLAINGQPVAYYHEDTVDDGKNYTITGRVPALLNGERVNLLLVFDNENPYGFIAGAQADYHNNETETVAKNITELEIGDKLEFLCDYYSYDGTYSDTYLLGEPMTVKSNMQISDVDVGKGNVKITYRFTDIYNQEYWTPALVR